MRETLKYMENSSPCNQSQTLQKNSLENILQKMEEALNILKAGQRHKAYTSDIKHSLMYSFFHFSFLFIFNKIVGFLSILTDVTKKPFSLRLKTQKDHIRILVIYSVMGLV